MNEARSLARNVATAPNSSTVPSQPDGVVRTDYPQLSRYVINAATGLPP